MSFFKLPGKRWGKKDVRPILALHGLMDNCSTFDRLFPLLNVESILAIDIPGHGFSSHVPEGTKYNYLDILFWLRMLIKGHFKWDKVDFLGHSFGSSLSFYYSSIYPNDVDKLISIDCARFNMAPKTDKFYKMMKIVLDNAEKMKNDRMPFEKHYENFVHFREIKKVPLIKEAYDALIKREVEEISPNKFIRTSDSRLLNKHNGMFPLEFSNAASKKIKCKVLSIRASNGVLVKDNLTSYEKQLKNMKSSCKKLVSIEVHGGHHVHLEQPEKLSNQINEFLNS